jgi:hypothetical protein
MGAAGSADCDGAMDQSARIGGTFCPGSFAELRRDGGGKVA